MEIGTRIKEMRKARNITQVQLAQMTGISQSSISAIEKLTNNPSAVTLKLIAAALGCTVGELLGEKKEQETPSTPLCSTTKTVMRMAVFSCKIKGKPPVFPKLSK